MSKYEWERGTITIPSKAWAKFKTDLREAYNAMQEQAFKDAKRIYDALMAKAKGRRKIDSQEWERWFSELATTRKHNGWSGYYDAEIDNYDKISDVLGVHHLIYGGMRDGKKMTRPVRPQKKSFPKQGQRSAKTGKGICYNVGHDAVIIVCDDKSRQVTWDVPENNHAVEHAKEHPLAGKFFGLLNKIEWTRGSGGSIVGNDEYNRDDRDYEGGGGNYVTSYYGPKKDDPRMRYMRI
jgi:hypothetical protein